MDASRCGLKKKKSENAANSRVTGSFKGRPSPTGPDIRHVLPLCPGEATPLALNSFIAPSTGLKNILTEGDDICWDSVGPRATLQSGGKVTLSWPL